MIQATKTNTIHEGAAFNFIGDAGPLTPSEFGIAVGTSTIEAAVWLTRAASDGYLYRDEFGRFSTSCPIPRVGF